MIFVMTKPPDKPPNPSKFLWLVLAAILGTASAAADAQTTSVHTVIKPADTPPAGQTQSSPAAAPPQTQTAPVPSDTTAPADTVPPPPTYAPAASSPGQAEASGQQAPAGQTPANSDQAPANQDSGMFVFRKRVEEVILHATVVDDQRHLVTDLPQSDFAVYESGLPQKITSFHREDVPVEMGIVIDNSGSMREKRAKVNDAVLNLIRDSNPADQIFVVNFSQNSYLDQDFTADVGLLRGALQRVAMRGSTALYDAIVASSVHLKNNPNLENKVLLVITDGRDNASRETLQKARLRLQQQNGPTMYVIGLLGDGLDVPDQQTLAALAESTGGAAFFPRTVDELDDVSRSISHDIRSRYSIGYRSTNSNQNSGYRAIHVTALAPGEGRLTVRTRKGYYPGESLQ